MLGYDDMRAWVRTHDLILNRCKVANVVTGDLFVVGHKGCRWWVDFLGRRVAEWRAYDLDSANKALAGMECAYRVLWDCRREGYACFV